MKITIEFVTAVMGMATAIIALITAVKNKRRVVVHSGQLFEQARKITSQGKEIEALKKNTGAIFPRFTIDTPKEGVVISGPVYNDMRGSFSGDIPESFKLWVLAKDECNYFLMNPPTQFTRTMGCWSQTNVRLETFGRWELHVCLANEDASAWFQRRCDSGNWSGFPSIPDGAETVRFVVVEKK